MIGILLCFLWVQRLQDTLALLEFTTSWRPDIIHLVHILHSSYLVAMNYWN